MRGFRNTPRALMPNVVLALLLVLALLALLLWMAARKTAQLAADAQAQVPPLGRFVEVPGARLHYVERGAARAGTPAVLMIHGLAGQLHHFAYSLVDAMAEHTRVVAVDRPGSGYSTRAPGQALTLPQQADAMAALIDALQLGPVLVVGHSLGGALALTLALRHPRKVRALALLAPLTQTMPTVPAAFRGLMVGSDRLRRWVGQTVAVPLTIASRDKVLGVVFGPEAVPADYGVRAGGLLSLRPSQFIAASEDLYAVPDHLPAVEADYPRLNEAAASGALPIDVLFGRGDRILSATEHGEGFVARVPAARLQLIEGGHMLPVTQPDQCARFVRQALARVSHTG
jgi:pimeloyl-ACP methyl ester carboxylesterase